MKGKFIVIEGIDGSGKTTQTKLLIKFLKKQGHKIKTIHFPQHGQEVFGKLVDAYLNNEFGQATKLDYRLASTLYALDRLEASKKIKKWIKQGNWVILDRYTESNFGHQAGKINNKKQRLKTIKWLHDLDYKVLQNPKPNLVLFLDVPVHFARTLIKKMGKVQDGHENDKKYLKNSRQAYLEAAKYFKYWQTIKCVSANKLLPKNKIHDNICKTIKK